MAINICVMRAMIKDIHMFNSVKMMLIRCGICFIISSLITLMFYYDRNKHGPEPYPNTVPYLA